MFGSPALRLGLTSLHLFEEMKKTGFFSCKNANDEEGCLPNIQMAKANHITAANIWEKVFLKFIYNRIKIACLEINLLNDG